MALIDRLVPTSSDRIKIHVFSAATYLWGQGTLTRAQVVAGFSLSAADQVQLDQLKTHYDGLTANAKLSFHGKVEALGILLEESLITVAFYKTQLGLT